MKFIAAILATFMIASPVYAGKIIFPYSLKGPGTYELQVAEGDVFTVRNEKAETSMREQFADIKLELKEFQLLKNIELNGINKTHELEIVKLNKIHDIENEYSSDQINTLKDRNKQLKKESSRTFLGINRDTIFFLLGLYAGIQIQGTI